MPATPHDHQHAEAFAVMLYAPNDGSEGEYLWNSRDGVTPFIISLQDGREATHTNWKMDRYEPEFDPPDGSRVFVDQSPDMARESWSTRVDEWWEHPEYPMSKRWATKDDAVRAMMREFMPGSPAIITAEEYKRRRDAGTLYVVSPVRPQVPPGFKGSPAGTDRFA